MTIKVPPRLCRPVPSSKSTASRPTWWVGPFATACWALSPRIGTLPPTPYRTRWKSSFQDPPHRQEVWYGNRLCGRQRPGSDHHAQRRTLQRPKAARLHHLHGPPGTGPGQARFHHQRLGVRPLARRLIDPFQGRKHLRRKLLATVGEPTHRFREDPCACCAFCVSSHLGL